MNTLHPSFSSSNASTEEEFAPGWDFRLGAQTPWLPERASFRNSLPQKEDEESGRRQSQKFPAPANTRAKAEASEQGRSQWPGWSGGTDNCRR